MKKKYRGGAIPEAALASHPEPSLGDLYDSAVISPSETPGLTAHPLEAAAPMETSIEYHTCPADEAAFLRVVLTPAIGSCLYSCIVLAQGSEEFVYEWHCMHRYPNGVARDPERELMEKKMAQDVADMYGPNVNAERTPKPEEYEPIAVAFGITLDIHFLYSGELAHFYINKGNEQKVKLFLCGSGGSSLTDCKGHFDLIVLEQPALGQPGTAPGH